MKKIIIFVALLCLYYNAFGQNIGLRGGFMFSDNEKINNTIGFGGYININNFSDKFELLFSIDNTFNNKKLHNINIHSTFSRINISTNLVYVLPLKAKLKIRVGTGISYNMIDASDGGLLLNWINTFEAKYIGIELLSNIHFQEIFELPLNFDIFIMPSYLLNIHYLSNPTNIESIYSGNLKLINVKLGISYIIK